MYRWLRNLHLFLGLFCCLYVLMYGVSAVKMAHRTWFSNDATITTTRVAIPPESAGELRTVARELMDRHGMRGELQNGRTTPEGYRFLIHRPGLNHLVQYSRASGEAVVERRVASFMNQLIQIHETSSLINQDWLGNAWGVLTGIVSTALILLALSGIYLWFKIHTERRIGAALLALSLGYSLTAMVLIRSYQ